MTQPATPAPQAGAPQGNPAPATPLAPAAPQPAAQAQPTPPAASPAEPKPPWGDDANFDAARAWQKIQAQEADKDKLRQQVAELTPFRDQVKAAEDAAKTETQRLQDQLTAANATAAKAAAESLQFRIALQHGVSDEDRALFLTATDEETLQKQAAAIAAKNAAHAAPQTPPGQTRPVEQLRPGALPTPAPQTLQEQIAAAEQAGDTKRSIALKTALLMQQQGNQ